MSSEALIAWNAIPNRAEVIESARTRLAENHRPTANDVDHVGLVLAIAHREGKGYVDETHTQLLQRLVTFTPDKLARTLQALDCDSLWPVEVRGTKGRGTRRSLGFLSLMGVAPSDNESVSWGDVSNLVGADVEPHGAKNEPRGANPHTPKDLPKENLNNSPKANKRDELAAYVAKVAMRLEGERVKPLEKEGARKRREAEYHTSALVYLNENDYELDTLPASALASVLVDKRHSRSMNIGDTRALHEWTDYVQNIQFTPSCTQCNDTGYVFNLSDLTSAAQCTCKAGTETQQQQKAKTR